MATKLIAVAVVALSLSGSGCVLTTPSSSGGRVPQQEVLPQSNRCVEFWEKERLRWAMMPLIRAMDHPCRLREVRVGIINYSEINAANGGGCQFYVTTGLLRRASERQLLGVMAHEISHQDLGHVAQAQVLGAGLNFGAAMLERLFPGSGALTPIAGTLIARGYGCSEGYAADRHAVEILRRVGYPKDVMVDTLNWIRRV